MHTSGLNGKRFDKIIHVIQILTNKTRQFYIMVIFVSPLVFYTGALEVLRFWMFCT